MPRMKPVLIEPTASEAIDPKPRRSNGQQARLRLPDASRTLFSDKGLAETSTREIAPKDIRATLRFLLAGPASSLK